MVSGAMSTNLLHAGADDRPRDRNCPPGTSPMREARADVAGIVEGHDLVVVGALVEREGAAADEVVRQLADVLRRRVASGRGNRTARSACSRSCRRRARHGRTRRRRCASRPARSPPRGCARPPCCRLSWLPMKSEKLAASEACEESVQEMPAAWKTLAYPISPSMCGSAKKSGARRDQQHLRALLVERESARRRRLLPSRPLPGPRACRAAPGSGRPRLLPILWTLPMISLEYFWPKPTVSMMSRAAIEISAVSMP